MLAVWGSLLDCLAFKLGGVKECNQKEKINIVNYKLYLKERAFFEKLTRTSIVIPFDLERDVFSEEVRRLSKKALGVELKV